MSQIIRVLNQKKEKTDFLNSLEQRFLGEEPEVDLVVANIIQAVKKNGEAAVLSYREKFEEILQHEPLTWNVNPKLLPCEILNQQNQNLKTESWKSFCEALKISIQRVENFHLNQLQQCGFSLKINSELECATRSKPLQSVAVYAPGGKAFYPSSLVMSVVPARVCGVQRIEVFTPYRSLENASFIETIRQLKISKVHLFGGAQAVACAAFGTNTIPKFDKIVGPGNKYVASAKRILQGRIGTDGGYAGPSEIAVLSDGSSNIEWVAWDMLAQAEHDEEAACVLVTTSAEEAQNIEWALKNCLHILQKKSPIHAKIASESLQKWGAVLLCQTEEESVEIVNTIAPEHLHIHTKKALQAEGRSFYLNSIENAGAMFLGKYTTESFGDYLAGPSHVLPTAGTSRFASPLGVYDFFKRTSVVSFSKQTAHNLSLHTNNFAVEEQLFSHGYSALCRSLLHEEFSK
jgi:histidinol dehydrogenase